MAKGKEYGYLLDGLNSERAEIIKRALQSIPEIKSITIHPAQGTVKLIATRDPEQQMKLACDVAGCIFRLKLGKGALA